MINVNANKMTMITDRVIFLSWCIVVVCGKQVVDTHEGGKSKPRNTLLFIISLYFKKFFFFFKYSFESSIYI